MKNFVITNVQWNYEPSRSIDAAPGEKRRTNRRSAAVFCTACKHRWNSMPGRGNGQFQEVIGAVIIQCPNCGVRETIEDKQFA